ncbi:MAG: hypothetical protein HYV07_06175 [Deltaproteobacteria bacterium]|nr:hypothetical protein [Deltaproteobacteria bacterium]
MRGLAVVRLGIVAALFAGAPILAFAGEAEDRARAKTLSEEADRLLRKGKVTDALARYAAAQTASPSPKTLLAIARAHKRLKQPALAANTYAELLRTAPEADPAAREAKRELARMDGTLARLKFVGPPGFSVRVDGAPVGRLPLEPVRVVPGQRDVTFESSDTFPVTKRVFAGRKLQVTVEVEVGR